jgi:hypothetical protein
MKKLIGFGIISRKLFIPFLYSLSQIIIDIVDHLYSKEFEYCDEENKCKTINNAIMNSYSIAIGAILVIIIPHIKAFSYKNEQNIIEGNMSKKKICGYYSLLIFLYTIVMSSVIYSSFNGSKSEVISPHLYGLCMKEGFEIIFLTIITYFVLKYKYFMHNYISLIFFVIVSLSIDLILGNIQKEIENIFQFILENIINVILDLIFLIYEKYLIEKLYFSPWTICSVNGAALFFANSLTFIYVLLKGKNNLAGGLSFTKDFYEYFDKIKISIIISQFIISIILQFIMKIFMFLTIYYFSINHILISYLLSKMANILIAHDSYKEFNCIILFIAQFLLLMIYLEVIELHFCGLDKNTRKSIQLREKEDMNLENLERNNSFNNNLVEISPGYMISKEYDILNDSSSIAKKLQKKNNMRIMKDMD